MVQKMQELSKRFLGGDVFFSNFKSKNVVRQSIDNKIKKKSTGTRNKKKVSNILTAKH